MEFCRAECNVLLIILGNAKYEYKLYNELVESSPAHKDMEVLAEETFDMDQKCALASQKADHILGCIRRMVSWAREIGYLAPQL